MTRIVIMIVIILLTVFAGEISAGIGEGFHFHADRMNHFPIPVEEMNAHQNDPDSTWMYDFEKDSHCARIDVKPFTLPSKWTACYKSNHDYVDNFVFLSLLSTKSGESIVEGFKNKTYRQMRGEGEIVNLITFFKALGWGGVWHKVGYKTMDTNGLAGKAYGWKRWEQWCVAFNMEVGQIISYVDGMDDGAGIRGDDFFKIPLEWANGQIKEKNLVTDVLVGCDPWSGSFGQITDIQMFDRILTPNEMVGMTTCSGEKLTGNLINSNTDPYSLYGSQVKQIWVNPEKYCPERNFSGVFFDQWHWKTFTAIDHCKKLNRKLISVTSEEDLDNLEFFFYHIVSWRGWLQTPIHKIGNGSWVDMETGRQNVLPWGPNQPIENDAYKYARIDFYERFDSVTLGSQTPSWGSTALCVSEDPKDYRLAIQILGLCGVSTFDTQYVFSREGPYLYVGRFNSEIRFMGDGIWLLTNKGSGRRGSQETKIATSHTSLALGTYDVRFEEDVCTKGKEDKVVKITITNCNDDQFTCFVGGCVLMENRCDRIVDCPDSSDEKGCAILRIDQTTYIKEYPPITVDDNRTVIKIPVNISLDILKILDINEVEGIFKVSFQLHSTWFDSRLVYANLKQDSDLNTLTEQEKEDIWTPNIVFSNTESQASVIKDPKVIARIGRLGAAKIGALDEAIKTFYFRGADNPITFSRIYDIRFICSYNMAWYPFDLQRCELLLKPFGNSGKYVYLIKNDINYFDKMDLSKYYIKQWNFESKDTDTGTGVEASIYLGRRLLSILTTVYIPSVLLNIIGHITNYFKPFYFESAIAVNLTVMLVLTSMFISVVAGLPVTSYIKMIDIWLLFNLTIPFIDVVLTCVIDNMRTDLQDERQINHHGKVRTVKSSEEDTDPADEPDKTSTPVEDIFQVLKKFNPDEGYNRDLVHKDERIQDNALKEYYNNIVITSDTKRNILSGCIMFSRQIKPVIAVIFVICYWSAGLWNYSRVE